MGLALDEPQDDDEIFKEKGLTFMISKELLERVKPVKVDFIETPRGSGYHITANLGPSGCGSGSCSC